MCLCTKSPAVSPCTSSSCVMDKWSQIAGNGSSGLLLRSELPRRRVELREGLGQTGRTRMHHEPLPEDLTGTLRVALSAPVVLPLRRLEGRRTAEAEHRGT